MLAKVLKYIRKQKNNTIFVESVITLKITFLGTGTSQGIPVIGSAHPVCLSTDSKDKRLRVSVLIEWNEFTYVVDCGPDFRQQMLTNNVSKIDGVLFTHEHNDHVAGLDDIRPFFFNQGDIPIYAHKRVLDTLKKRFDYIFVTKHKYPGAPSVKGTVIKNEPFRLGNLTVMPINAYHNRVQVFGFRFKDIAYLTDVKTVDDEEVEKLKGVKILVVNALRERPHHSHFNLEEALAFIDLVKPERAYLTHISQYLGFHEDVQQKLPKNVFLAYDNLVVNL